MLNDFNYAPWFEELHDIPPLLPLNSDKEIVKEGTEIKILTPN